MIGEKNCFWGNLVIVNVSKPEKQSSANNYGSEGGAELRDKGGNLGSKVVNLGRFRSLAKRGGEWGTPSSQTCLHLPRGGYPRRHERLSPPWPAGLERPGGRRGRRGQRRWWRRGGPAGSGPGAAASWAGPGPGAGTAGEPGAAAAGRRAHLAWTTDSAQNVKTEREPDVVKITAAAQRLQSIFSKQKTHASKQRGSCRMTFTGLTHSMKKKKIRFIFTLDSSTQF